ncbi:MAG: NERD domain-containing protein [Lentisphaeria bacterium]
MGAFNCADKTGTKSPIKEPALRLPGESLGEELDRLRYDVLVPYIFGCAVFWILAALQFLDWLRPSPPKPFLWLAIALVVTLIAVIRVWRARRGMRNLWLGLDGEKAVAESLTPFIAKGYHLIHDIVFDGFNLDHAVIGPTGIYAIETKTHAKPARGMHDVVYDGECVTVNGFKPDRDPLIQSVAIAKELARLIQSLTGRKYFVQPVVFYPGWYVRRNCANSSVWVLNPGQFGAYLRYEKPDALSTDEVNQITALLEKQVRGQGRKAPGGYGPSA